MVPGVTKGWCLVPSSEWMFWVSSNRHPFVTAGGACFCDLQLADRLLWGARTSHNLPLANATQMLQDATSKGLCNISSSLLLGPTGGGFFNPTSDSPPRPPLGFSKATRQPKRSQSVTSSELNLPSEAEATTLDRPREQLPTETGTDHARARSLASFHGTDPMTSVAWAVMK